MRVSMDSLGFHAPRTDIRFSRLSLCVVVCLGSPLCLSSVLASNRMVAMSPCSLASHIGGVGVRDMVAIAIGQCEGPRRPLGKDKYGGGEPYPGDCVCVRRSRKDESFARETTSHAGRGKDGGWRSQLRRKGKRDGQRS